MKVQYWKVIKAVQTFTTTSVFSFRCPLLEKYMQSKFVKYNRCYWFILSINLKEALLTQFLVKTVKVVGYLFT